MKDKKSSRKKHKRLDAICEKAYSQSHSGVEVSKCHVDVDETELRRSTRIRKAPVLLDTSPPPSKKRRKIDKRSGERSVDRGDREGSDKREFDCPIAGNLEDSCRWQTRLRSRSTRGGLEVRDNKNSTPKGKRKLFDELEAVKKAPTLKAEEFERRNLEVVHGKSTVVKSKRPGRVKASNVSRNEHQEIDLGGAADIDKETSEEVIEVSDEGTGFILRSEMECARDEKENGDDAPSQLVDVEKSEGEADSELEQSADEAEADIQLEECQSEAEADIQLEECQSEGEGEADIQLEEGQGKDKLEATGQDMQVEEKVHIVEEEQRNIMEVDESIAEKDNQGVNSGKPLENETLKKLKKKDYTSDDPLLKLRMKEGRRCGLCGTANNGKPPKRLVQDGAGSDNEVYSGSSSAEELNYDIWDGFGDEPCWLGRLLGPINDRHGIAGIWVHQQCAVWSPEVYFAGLGCLKNVRAALCRGRALKCSRCGRPGATIGCRVDRCPRTYHLPCARANSCIFDHRKFLIACTDHKHFFQPQGSQYIDRLKKMKARKMKMEIRKMSNDAWRKDVEAEEKWLENCGEDEEFLKRESKRLHRDLLRIAPSYIGGSSGNKDMQFEGWESVAGLQNVIQCMKEVVILPLLYPEFFNNLGLSPPRGVLLHGYPGTGKTLVVRALIGSCARGDKRIAYFARKGADCLGKYVGDAERQLRLLFQVAEKSQPSIIFFDEIDGLAPCRTRQQDQTHSSVVSTLLALMDGLKSRGSVVVIGATNRPDAIDPALRRPGRFDREIYFPLPSVKDREAILSLHTLKWPKPISGSLLKFVARKTGGFAGADLQALCTQAAIISLRRSFPLQEMLSTAAEKVRNGQRPPLPVVSVEERDWLEALSCAPPPCSRREAGTAANDLLSSPIHTYLGPCLLQPLSRLLVSLNLDERVWLPAPLSKAATWIENVIFSALEKKKMRRDNWWSYAPNFLQQSHISSQIEDGLRRAGIIMRDTCLGSFGMSEDDAADGNAELEPTILQCARPWLQNISYVARKKSGFHILISGNPRSGQRHLASCLLHYFVGNVEVQKVDLATISLEGHGDTVQGLTQVLMRCASLHSCMIFMPRIELWAMEICDQQDDQRSNAPPTESESSQGSACTNRVQVDRGDQLCPSGSQSAATKASYLWNSFIEQAEYISVNTSLMILATSEVQFSELPIKIRQFFKGEILRDNCSTPMGNIIPKFSLEVDGKFDVDMVLDSCAMKLSKDLAQHFVQILHYKNHNRIASFKEESICDSIQGDVGAPCSRLNPVSETGSKDKQCPLVSVSPALLRNVPVKGKSNLLLAISTFGYQILLYPHFAELCWVTSKLKEGPEANIRGPWKGWPFNSCVVRPISSEYRVAAASGDGNIKIKEKSSLVRGLIAVGLSAYRGEYTSLRQVALEVRKVLEILVGHFNAKIQGGKDGSRYIRLMSQVAYLEDMVLSWVHALHRLEVDAQSVEAVPRLTRKASLDDDTASKDFPSDDDICKEDLPNGRLHEPEVLDENPGESNADSINGTCLNRDGVIDHPITISELTVLEGEKAESLAFDDPVSLSHCQISVLDGDNSEHVAEAPKNDMEVGRDPAPVNHANRFAESNSADLKEDDHCCSGDICSSQLCTFQLKDASLEKDNVPLENIVKNTNGYNVDTGHSAGCSSTSDIMCLYHCCSECVVNLHHLVKEILNCIWSRKANHSAVEDVHDFVSCLSSKLHSAIRRLSLSEKSSYSFEEKLMEPKLTKYCQKMGVSQCKDSGRGPTECHCHSRSKETNLSRCGLDLEFSFRNGVLVISDFNYDLSSHCSYKALCLCSLIEWIVMSKDHLCHAVEDAIGIPFG